jgi:hypothetical protein
MSFIQQLQSLAIKVERHHSSQHYEVCPSPGYRGLNVAELLKKPSFPEDDYANNIALGSLPSPMDYSADVARPVAPPPQPSWTPPPSKPFTPPTPFRKIARIDVHSPPVVQPEPWKPLNEYKGPIFKKTELELEQEKNFQCPPPTGNHFVLIRDAIQKCDLQTSGRLIRKYFHIYSSVDKQVISKMLVKLMQQAMEIMNARLLAVGSILKFTPIMSHAGKIEMTGKILFQFHTDPHHDIFKYANQMKSLLHQITAMDSMERI